MKILLIASFADSLINFRLPLIRELQRRGIVVDVAAPFQVDDEHTIAQLSLHGVQIHNISLQRNGINLFQDLFTFYSLFKLLKEIEPECVLAYTVKPVVYGMLAAWLAGVPRRYALITGLGYAFVDNDKSSLSRKSLGWLVRKLYSYALSRAEKVFFQNPDDQSLFINRNILNRNALSCVLNGSGVDLSHFFVTPLPSGSIRFLMIARLLGDKGVREYAEAARRIRQIYPNVRFLLVGWIDGNPNSISKEELDSWVLEGNLEFLGKLQDVRPAISQCNVFVLPSYREGTPRTVLEAMAMGRAIITTDTPGCRETVVNNENGYLIEVKSVDALTNAMILFIANPYLCARMGSRSRIISENKYDVNKVNAKILNEMHIS